jgi:hypothetical protein
LYKRNDSRPEMNPPNRSSSRSMLTPPSHTMGVVPTVRVQVQMRGCRGGSPALGCAVRRGFDAWWWGSSVPAAGLRRLRRKESTMRNTRVPAAAGRAMNPDVDGGGRSAASRTGSAEDLVASPTTAAITVCALRRHRTFLAADWRHPTSTTALFVHLCRRIVVDHAAEYTSALQKPCLRFSRGFGPADVKVSMNDHAIARGRPPAGRRQCPQCIYTGYGVE